MHVRRHERWQGTRQDRIGTQLFFAVIESDHGSINRCLIGGIHSRSVGTLVIDVADRGLDAFAM